jgi:adenylate cyclase
MAVFGMTKQYQSPEESAILAGLKMIECIKSLRKELDEPLEIGVGINSGLATAGYMGTEDYIEFTVLGYPVNIAWGLESLARPNRLFIGYPLTRRLPENFWCKRWACWKSRSHRAGLCL